MTTEELIAEIERLDAAATAGPWTIEGGGGVSMNGNRDYYIIEADTVWLLNVLGRVTPQERKANAEAIASYRTLAVEAARRLRELTDAHGRLQSLVGNPDWHRQMAGSLDYFNNGGEGYSLKDLGLE